MPVSSTAMKKSETKARARPGVEALALRRSAAIVDRRRQFKNQSYLGGCRKRDSRYGENDHFTLE